MLSKTQVNNIIKLYTIKNNTYSQIAKKYGVSPACIGKIMRNENHKKLGHFFQR